MSDKAWYISLPKPEFEYEPFKRRYYGGKKTKKFSAYLKKKEEYFNSKPLAFSKIKTIERHSYEQ